EADVSGWLGEHDQGMALVDLTDDRRTAFELEHDRFDPARPGGVTQLAAMIDERNDERGDGLSVGASGQCVVDEKAVLAHDGDSPNRVARAPTIHWVGKGCHHGLEFGDTNNITD